MQRGQTRVCLPYIPEISALANFRTSVKRGLLPSNRPGALRFYRRERALAKVDFPTRTRYAAGFLKGLPAQGSHLAFMTWKIRCNHRVWASNLIVRSNSSAPEMRIRVKKKRTRGLTVADINELRARCVRMPQLANAFVSVSTRWTRQHDIRRIT